ncbi:uncharacterized protein PHACADRAFT_206413 [Phanerochaete carnosa HHB-10118-sp]|uniref:Uncharacterized protein n=1 Tax=Phanerochaete carnosa (strain HHB-10118-sp) TaxID=650164 RepID=K5W0Z7_PHACS|nr:uncharacterized protein PHACADRAFT_206413 [Phanerochaete carnosa HHB-10118-sp]EKM57513.1 hypothetical protein PHACADRAFT_206413 [Phanerochaete carnosa HHB-10118-sp]
MAIDSSVLDSKVHFVRPSKTGTIGTTYGSDEYDRTSIHVSRRKKLALALPERGRRMYCGRREVSPDESPVHSPVSTSKLDGQTPELLKHIATRDGGSQKTVAPCSDIAFAGGLSCSLPQRRFTNSVDTPMESDSDEDNANRAMAFYMCRPGTPLPPLCLRMDSFDEDDSSAEGRILSSRDEQRSSLVDVPGSGMSPVAETTPASERR